MSVRSLRAAQSSSVVAEAIRYGLIGVGNTLLTLAIIFALIYWLDAQPLLANAVGYAIGFCCGYVFNRLWTFRSQAPVGRSVGRYVIAALVAYGLNALVIHFGIEWAGVSEYWIQPVGAVVYTVSLFVLSRVWVFRHDDVSRKVP